MQTEMQELKEIGWSVLELMGHRRIAGFVKEELIANSVMLRIDMETADGPMTQYYGGSSVYCITPTTEELAKAFASKITVQPVNRWELPQVEDHSDDEVY